MANNDARERAVRYGPTKMNTLFLFLFSFLSAADAILAVMFFLDGRYGWAGTYAMLALFFLGQTWIVSQIDRLDRKRTNDRTN